MLSILHHQGDSRSSFGFTRKVLGGGGDQGEEGGLRGMHVQGDQDKGSCIECKTLQGFNPLQGSPSISVQFHQQQPTDL